jgi:hypothetical protein
MLIIRIWHPLSNTVKIEGVDVWRRQGCQKLFGRQSIFVISRCQDSKLPSPVSRLMTFLSIICRHFFFLQKPSTNKDLLCPVATFLRMIYPRTESIASHFPARWMSRPSSLNSQFHSDKNKAPPAGAHI